MTAHLLELGPYTLSLLSSVAPPALALDRVDRVELDERGPKIVARRTVTLGDPMLAGHLRISRCFRRRWCSRAWCKLEGSC
jgi:hypothetical protein